MIECFLSEHTYYFSDGHKTHRFFRAKADDPLWALYSEYQRHYLMLIAMFDALIEDNIKNIIVYNHTRMVEEINSKTEPLNKWGQGALIYIRRNLFPYFIDYVFRKCSQEHSEHRIVEGQQQLSSYGADRPKIKNFSDIIKRRVQKFKDENKRKRY